MDTALLALGIAFLNLCIGVIVVVRGNAVRLTRHFFVIAILCSLWNLSEYLTLTAFSAKDATFFAGLRTVTAYLAMVSLLNFSRKFAGLQSKIIATVNWLFILLVIPLMYFRSFTNLLITGVSYTGGYFTVIPGKLYLVPVLTALVIAFLTVKILYDYSKKVTEEQDKGQAKFLVGLMVLLPIFTIITYGILPFLGNRNLVQSVSIMGLFPMAIGLSFLRNEFKMSISFLVGNLHSKIFSAALGMILFILLPSLIIVNLIFITGMHSRIVYQLNEDAFEKRKQVSEYFTDLQARTDKYAKNEVTEQTEVFLQHKIDEVSQTDQPISALAIVETDGQEIVGAGKLHKAIIQRLGSIVINTPYITEITSIDATPLIISVAPMFGTANMPQKYLVMAVPATVLYKITSGSRSTLFDSSKTYIIDGSGTLLTPYLTYDNSLLHTLKVPIFKEDCENKQSTVFAFSNYLDLRETPVVGAKIPLQAQGWCLVVEVDKSETEGSRRLMILSTAAISMLGIVFIVLVAEVLGGILSDPITKLKAGVARIMAGDFSIPVRVDSDDEIGELSRAFDVMTEDLRDAQENISRKVKEQTIDLESQKNSLVNQQKQMVTLLSELEDEKERSDFLAQDLAKFKQAVDYASDHIIITTPDGMIVYANQSVERITGYSPKELIGQKAGSKTNWGGHMPLAFYKKLWNTLTVKKKPFGGELTNKRKSGEMYTVISNISPVLDNHKNVVFFVGIERDISKEKQIDRAKSEFVSLASHQLRTPLSAINWFAEMLIDGDAGKLNKEQKQYVKEIYDGNQRMIDLVTALLNVSRLDLGTFTVEPTEQALSVLAKEALNELEPMISSKHIMVKSIFEKLPLISVDKKLMYIIFQNLLSNAVKYTPEKGKVTLSIQKKNSTIIITVTDTGMGIPLDQQAHIYEKLFRASNAKASVTEGTGLGLYIVKAILDATGGTIALKSEVDKGTIFTVTMPAAGMKPKVGAKSLT